MRKLGQLGCFGSAVLAFLVLVGPFLLPISPLEGTSPPHALADADSRFLEMNGLTVHYKETGQGAPLIILLHGFLGSTYSWREVQDHLGAYGTVISFDRPGFGLTERQLSDDWPGENPYTPEAQVALIHQIMDEYDAETAVLIGNSAGGALAAFTAVQNPARVGKLVLVDAAIFSGGGTPTWLSPLLKLPQIDRLGPLVSRSVKFWGDSAAQSAWADPARLTDEILAGVNQYRSVDNWDLALWEFTKASRPLGLETALLDLEIPTLVITGEEDKVVPAAESVRLAEVIPGAELVILAECGHVPHEECPDRFLEAVVPFLANPGQ